MPKVSVCIPTYNYARFLPEAIESILNQNFTDFELLIIDDCSKDNTAEVVQRYAAKDARIRFSVNSPNIGMVNNWNLCLREARGEFIKFVFGDDLLTSKDTLKKMLAPFAADSAISLVASARDLLDAESKVIRTRSSFGKTTVLDGDEAIRRCLLEQKNLIGEPTVVMFRKKDAARGFNKDYRQIVDLEMWYHLMEQGKLAYLNEPLCAFRCHPDQQTEHNSRSNATLDDTTLLLKEYLKKPYLHFGWWDRTLITYDFCYQVWKTYRKNKLSQEHALETINKACGYTKFRVTLPLYKIVRPCRKLIRHVARKTGGQEATFETPPQSFPGSGDYWKNRYKAGGTSGAGSYNRLAEFKAEVLNGFVRDQQIQTVIEYGSGDGNQLKLAAYPAYQGFDVSLDAIARCEGLFAGDKTKTFKLAESYAGETAELTLSLDVIYHLIEDTVFEAYMNQLFGSATKFVIIYSSDTDEQVSNLAVHVKHRKFSRWVADNQQGWKLKQHLPNRYPLVAGGDDSQSSFADFFVYEKAR